MIAGRLALALILAAAPLAAQQQPTWDPDSWTAEGWSVAPLDGLPSGESMLDDQLRGEPLPQIEREDPLVMRPAAPEPVADPVIRTGTAEAGAVLRGLDKVSGATADLDLAPGQSARFGRVLVTLRECRYPEDNPASDAFALIEIVDVAGASRLFSGWMLASSPALNPLDHARYDVWVLRCKSA
ncbi:DUF2155 domain-containing protein [Rhodovulum euryhalinum]|uniref:DUF2155 domain-containing protein n=1 Tax=Rhodovulum euryhalinum TaxID=35805 RepID=A0A4R2KBT7_9RHOB|nr:DUF2155 domain-containing protein [Rhodovulum euryhalinum]TCO70304.1 hypothetical protein EV655_11069 [Rhodovulum euryhalinum]